MINSLRLQNFRKHLDRTFEFGPGINAIRGENENGKTTVLEGFAYLCFGARALKETLDDVVTYGQPASKLRIDGVLTHLGIEYTAYRAKSGAEVTFGKERVTGQDTVTEFFEKLFGVDAKMAGKLMISSQKAIAASITAGPTDAGKMIEALADFDLIENLVEMAQAKLVCGVTTGVEGRIAALVAQVAEVAEVESLAPLQTAVTDALVSQIQAGKAHASLEEKRDDLDVDLANRILADEKRHQATIETTTYELSQLDAALAVEAPIAPTPAEIAGARAAVEAEKGLARAVKIHAELTATKVEDLWDKDLASLEAEIAATQVKSTEAEAKRQAAADELSIIDGKLSKVKRDTAVAVATIEGKMVKELVCTFCDKDLKDVPEVEQRNSKLSDELVKLHRNTSSIADALEVLRAGVGTLRDRFLAERNEADSYLADLRAVLTRNSAVETLYAKAGDLVTVDRTTVPGLWTWAGPAVTGERPDVAGALAALEDRERKSVAFEATRRQQQVQRDAVKVKQDAAVISRRALQVKDANETLGEAAEIDAKLVDARAALETAKQALRTAQSALATKQALQEQAAKAAELAKANLAAAEKDLAEMQANNARIKKLRAARPVITSKLWSIVLAGSSGYLGQVRGEQSTLTRDEKMFRCNGRPAAGLSGSGEDMLGLAVRISLTKTFLAGLGFLILDEPAAACSDSRESAMLGMLSTLGFEQIILVTHSDLCDAYADKIITV